jgi:hypothetical protein
VTRVHCSAEIALTTGTEKELSEECQFFLLAVERGLPRPACSSFGPPTALVGSGLDQHLLWSTSQAKGAGVWLSRSQFPEMQGVSTVVGERSCTAMPCVPLLGRGA